ncbi:MAG: radical SAM protein [Oscillospiraceae bacterium]
MLNTTLLNGNQYVLNGCYIEITSRCNLRCKHCYNESGELDSEISCETFQNVLNCYEDGAETDITLSGGEPLLHPQFWGILDSAINAKIKKILIITNATIIDAQVAEKFSHRKDVGIQLSINGSTPSIHDALCGKGSFEKTMAGLAALQAVEFEKIVVRCMITKSNSQDLVNTVQMLVDHGIKNIFFGILRVQGRTKQNVDELGLSLDEQVAIIKNLHESKKIANYIAEGIGIKIPEPFSGGCPLVLPGKEVAPLNPRIDSKGNVHLCQAFEDVLYSIGNINDSSLNVIFESYKFKNLINFFSTGLSYIKECEKCVWQSNCGRGCVADILAHGSIQNTDGLCKLRKHVMATALINQKAK